MATKYSPAQREQLLNTLRNEILSARLKVTLDKELGRSTSAAVKRLASIDPPPLSPTQFARPQFADVNQDMRAGYAAAATQFQAPEDFDEDTVFIAKSPQNIHGNFAPHVEPTRDAPGAAHIWGFRDKE